MMLFQIVISLYFHHVPKTGGSSITAALAPYCRNYDGQQEYIPEETHDDAVSSRDGN